SYATDAKGWMGTFSWKPGQAYSQFNDLNFASAAPQAHSNQAVDIERRYVPDADQPPVTDRLLSRNYTYLVLVDGGYFGTRLPEPGVVCPEDQDALQWQRNFAADPNNVLEGTLDPDPGASAAFHRFLGLWSTYQSVPCAWSDQTGPDAV